MAAKTDGICGKFALHLGERCEYLLVAPTSQVRAPVPSRKERVTHECEIALVRGSEEHHASRGVPGRLDSLQPKLADLDDAAARGTVPIKA